VDRIASQLISQLVLYSLFIVLRIAGKNGFAIMIDRIVPNTVGLGGDDADEVLAAR